MKLPLTDFRAVIPAGGAGTRLWPLSRRQRPKFLLDVTGSGRTLIQATWNRLMPLAGPHGIIVVTGAAHQSAIRAQLPVEVEILTEPSPRNSMAAIGLAAAVLRRREGDVVIGSFAADHVITERAAFDKAVAAAVRAAREGYVATVGIRPTRPATGFGYIRVGEPIRDAAAPAPGARHVVEFVEKPGPARAEEYLRSGDYLWNAGMFLTRVSVLLDRLAEYRPALAAGLEAIAAAWDTPAREEVLAERWPGLESIAIDHAIAEPLAAAGGVAVVPGDFGWDDVGDWGTLAQLQSKDADGVARLGASAPVIAVDAANPLVAMDSPARPVAVVGIDGAIVAEVNGILLVTTREAAGRVKEVPGLLPGLGLEDLA